MLNELVHFYHAWTTLRVYLDYVTQQCSIYRVFFETIFLSTSVVIGKSWEGFCMSRCNFITFWNLLVQCASEWVKMFFWVLGEIHLSVYMNIVLRMDYFSYHIFYIPLYQFEEKQEQTLCYGPVVQVQQDSHKICLSTTSNGF